jgi:hypothetical protein
LLNKNFVALRQHSSFGVQKGGIFREIFAFLKQVSSDFRFKSISRRA